MDWASQTNFNQWDFPITIKIDKSMFVVHLYIVISEENVFCDCEDCDWKSKYSMTIRCSGSQNEMDGLAAKKVEYDQIWYHPSIHVPGFVSAKV